MSPFVYLGIGFGLVLLLVVLWRENKNYHITTNTVDLFSTDLTMLARQGKLDPVVGRQHEIERVIQILSRRTKNNPVLIGDSGVGKTAIVEELANQIARGQVPETLRNKRLLSLDLSGLVAGTKYRGEFEKRLKSVTDEIIASQRNIILFIDELHTLAEAGEATGAIDAADILKPALARGELQAIGATTPDDYEKIKVDVTLERRFQPIFVGEPNAAETVSIVKGLRERYQRHHHVVISDAAIEAAVRLSNDLLKDRHFPDKAIDLIDEASAKVHLAQVTAPRYSAKPPQVTEKDINDVIKDWRMDSRAVSNAHAAAHPALTN